MTTTLSSLKQLKVGERVVVVRLTQSKNDSISRKLKGMGITLGSTLTIEQRFPRYVVRVRGSRIALSEDVLGVIYVRFEATA